MDDQISLEYLPSLLAADVVRVQLEQGEVESQNLYCPYPYPDLLPQ